ncbi:MAG: molecular chaperone TorD family protein [Eggerthellaceae bacterium]|nr:molecular chaperone TorD family protein [Eggerthellaceae bacterium]
MDIDETQDSLGEGLGEVGRLASQADLAQILALFFRRPSTELAAGLAEGTVALDISQILAELALDDTGAHGLLGTMRGGGPEALLKALRVEYTRLFAHPEHPVLRIYEALFLYELRGRKGERPVLFVNPAALDAERLYRQAGLTQNSDFNESGDHFGVQLDFAAFLLRQRIELLSKGQEGQEGHLAGNAALFDEFKARHLSKWLQPLGDMLVASAQHPAYQAVGHLCCALQEGYGLTGA